MALRSRALPAFARPCSRRLAPLSSGEQVCTRVTRDSPSVPAEGARERLVHEHVRVLDANDPDDLGQQLSNRHWNGAHPQLRCSLPSGSTKQSSPQQVELGTPIALALDQFRRVICPSTWPLLQGGSRAARTVCSS